MVLRGSTKKTAAVAKKSSSAATSSSAARKEPKAVAKAAAPAAKKSAVKAAASKSGKKGKQVTVAAAEEDDDELDDIDDEELEMMLAAEAAGGFSDDDDSGEDLADFMAQRGGETELTAELRRAARQPASAIINRAIVGDNVEDIFGGLDPLSTSGLALENTPLLHDVAEQRAEECKNEDALLEDAHRYFSDLNRAEKARNKAAMKKIKDMRAVNKKGGDKDGFQYVLPSNVKKFAMQEAQKEGNGGALVDPDTLESHFRGDGIAETTEKPMRRKKVRRHTRDDFYASQVQKRWTANAESFLQRGRAHRQMFADKSRERNARNL